PQPQGERIARVGGALDRAPELRQRGRPLRHDDAAVGRAVVVDLLPVRRMLRELAIVEPPRVLGGAQDLALDLERLREERAHLPLERSNAVVVDTVPLDLEEAPFAARGVDRIERRAARQVAHVDDGQTVRGHGLAPSGGLARLQPLRQQRVGIDVDALVVADALLLEPALYRAVAPRVEQIRAAADVLAADEDLRDRPRAGALRAHRADLAAPIAGLVLDGVEVDAAVIDAEPREQLADGPAELAPLEREQHDRLAPDDVVDEALRIRVERDGLGLRLGGRGRRGRRRIEAAARRRARQGELLVGHLLADVLEQRRRHVALPGVGQHADDVRAGRRAPRNLERGRER